MVHYAVLGSVELFRDGQRRSLGGLRQRALLIEFLVHANEELSTDRLIDDVWGSEGSVKRLHTAIKRLRDALGPGPDGETPLRRTTSGYRLVVAAGELDADVFEQAVLEASAAIGDDPLRARDLVEHALTLWRGPALADVAYESFAQDAIRRLNERRADAEELGARAELLLGRGNDAIRRLDELVAKHPERGAVVALLMEALYAAGRQEQALAAYQRVRRHLLDVGLEPGPELVALERRIHLRDATLAAGPELPPALRRLPPCVGRDDERAQFKEVIDEAREGSRRVVCIGGEPGVGKTLLAGHAALLAHDEGFVVGWGASFESVQAPYATWIEPLSELASRAPSEVLDRYRPQLSRVVPSVAEGDAVARDLQTAHFDPEGSRYRLFDAVLGLLSDLAAESPVLIAFDDVQWADSDSLALVHYVTEALRDGLPCTLVLTYRDTELDASPALQDLLASLRRVEGVTRLRLAGLGATDIAALVTGRMTHAPHGGWTQLVSQISSATGGNPFFIGEMLRHIEENTGPRSLSEIGVPEGVHDVVRQRVRRVGADAHAVLGPAAVIGHEFSVDVLMRLVEIDDPVPALDAAAAAALVVPQGIGRYAFAHTLIWRSVYESLSETRRAVMHQRVAAALEADANHDPGQLAHHLTRSGLASEQRRAATYALQAGANALKQYAPGVAKGWFSEALRLLLAHGGDVDVCDVLIGLGEAKRRAGDRSFRRNLLKVARVATRRGDHELLARAVLANTMGGFGAAGSADRLSLQALEDAYVPRSDRC
jgi:DNA-binding SARP family transcriptional activator